MILRNFGRTIESSDELPVREKLERKSSVHAKHKNHQNPKITTHSFCMAFRISVRRGPKRKILVEFRLQEKYKEYLGFGQIPSQTTITTFSEL